MRSSPTPIQLSLPLWRSATEIPPDVLVIGALSSTTTARYDAEASTRNPQRMMHCDMFNELSARREFVASFS